MTDFAALKKCLGDELAKKIFYCGVHSKKMVMYVPDEKTAARCVSIFKNKAEIDVKTTESLNLEKTKSLEAILAQFPHQQILFDPTSIVERVKALVGIAKTLRVQIGKQLKGCYFDSENRILHLVLNGSSHESSSLIASIVANHTQTLSKTFAFRTNLSTSEPVCCMAAIDKGSVKSVNVRQWMEGISNKLKLPLLLASVTGLGMANTAAAHTTHSNQPHVLVPTHTIIPPNDDDPWPMASPDYPDPNADLPAVAYLNGWLGLSGGYFHTDNKGNGYSLVGEGGFAFPIMHRFGAQFNAFDGTVIHSNLLVADAYLFWRNPLQGLIGFHYRYLDYDHLYSNYYGLRGEGYLCNWTVILEGGSAHNNIKGSQIYGEAILQWYPKPNWRLDAGYFNTSGNQVGQLGTEYQFGLSSLPGLSIFADVGAGNHHLRYAYLGLRYYFGCPKSLIRRQREDLVDPTYDLVSLSEAAPRIPVVHS